MKEYVQAGNMLIHTDQVAIINTENLETKLELEVMYVTDTGFKRAVINGPQAIEALMILDPTALESRRLRWARNKWAIHNLVGHPLMQVFAFFKMYDLAMWIHDATVPKPLGKK